MTAISGNTTKVFGAGSVYALVAGLSPVKIGILQDIEIDIAAAVSELYGQYQFPVAVGRGKGKITGKAKTGQFDVNLFNSLYYGGTVDTTGYQKVIEGETIKGGASEPTVSVANLGSSNVVDLGLYYSATPTVQLTYSTDAAPTIGNYSFASSGAYTVSTDETSSTPFLANYQYLSSAGEQLVVTNQLMGIQPVFELHLWEGYTDFSGRTNFDIKLNRCVSTKMSFPFKNSDFMVSDFEFSAFADSNNGLFTLGVGT